MAETLTRYDTDKTPLAIADKAMFIHHLNEEHQDELAMFINAFTPASVGEYDIVSIKELYPDGLLLDVMTMNRYQNNSNTLKDGSSTDNSLAENLSSVNHQYFINFFVPISNAETLHEQYIALLQASATKLGKRTIKLQEQYFSVIDGYYISPNMYRLVVTAPDNIPLNHPGYAYLFELNAEVLTTINGESENNDKPLQRYYTLRKAWRDPIRSSVQAWIDVYIHGNTPGGNWARSMQTTEEERTLINPSLEWRPTEDVSVLANIFYQDDPEMVPSTPLPAVGTVYNASYGKLGRDAYAGDEWNHFSKEVLMPSVTVNWAINDKLTFKHILRYTDAEAQQRNMYNQEGFITGSDKILNRVAYTTDEKINNWTTDNQLAYQLDTANTSHNLLFGVEYQETDSSATYYDAGADGTPNLDLSNPDFSQIDAGTLPLDIYRQKQDIEQSQLGFYLQDEMQWQDLTVVAGLRHDKFDSTTEQTDASKGAVYSNKTIDNSASKTSGRLAAIYDFDNGFSPYASYSQSFQPVVGSNFVTNKAFEPTTADQLEAGIKYLSPDRATQGTLAVFDITQKNVVVADEISYRSQTQTGEITSKGFEVSGSHMLSDWVDIAASYSYIDAEITEDEFNPDVVGNTPAQTAKHKATLWADYYATDKLTLNAGVRYENGMQLDKQNSDELPSVTLVDIGGSYQIHPMLTVGASINNLFDKTYVGTCYDSNNCWMGPERQMSVSLKANF